MESNHLNSGYSERDRAALKILVGGILGMVVAMGIGRFTFTPILPLMQRDLGMSNTVAGWLAGYFMSVAVAITILGPTGDWLGEDSRWQVSVLVPIIEELAKALPVLLVYLGVRRTAWLVLVSTKGCSLPA